MREEGTSTNANRTAAISHFLRGHYPDQVRRSVTVRSWSPSQPGSPSSRWHDDYIVTLSLPAGPPPDKEEAGGQSNGPRFAIVLWG